MALQFIEGFDHETTELLGAKSGLGLNLSNTGIVTGRLGTGKALSFVMGTSGGVTFNVSGAPTTFIAGAAFWFQSGYDAGLFEFRESTTVHARVVWVASSGKVQLFLAGSMLAESGFAAINHSTWNYIECKAVIHDSTGSIEVRLNGALLLSVSGDTRNGGTGGIDNVRIGNFISARMSVDDVYGLDTTGAVNNDFLGDVSVVTLRPNAAGDSTQFTPSAGSNYECVDEETVDSDTSYVQSSTVGHVDLYNVGALGVTPAAIYGVQVSAFARKDDAGNRALRTKVKSGATVADGAALGLSTDYQAPVQLLQLNPADSAAWEVADIDALQIGFEVES